MKPARTNRLWLAGRQRGSVLIIVLWIALGLVSVTLYFAGSMSLELRASDNRASGLAADQAISGAARYVNYLLASIGTNGAVPDPTTYQCEAVKVGDAHYWLIGRGDGSGPADRVSFGLVDEASKLNLNAASSNMLIYLPRMTPDLASGILDWRSTNGGLYQSYYAFQNPPYQSKNNAFETVDELRMVYGADLDTLVGEDANRNGILDPNEDDQNRNGTLDPGVLEYLTACSREPTTNSAGTALVSIRQLTRQSANTGGFSSLLQTNLSVARAGEIIQKLFPSTNQVATTNVTSPVVITAPSPLAFFRLQLARKAQVTADEFGKIANYLSVTNGAYIQGRVNINTASAAVLACLPGISDNPSLAQTLVDYRLSNPDKLTSVAWVVDALGQNNNQTLDALQAVDCITTQSFQFTADVAAIGPNGRGYRRVRFIFDTSGGTPQIIYRQDLSHLGWALGKNVRQVWLEAKR